MMNLKLEHRLSAHPDDGSISNLINSISALDCPPSSQTSTTNEKSLFIQSSIADIPLSNLEELLSRCSIDDAYIGPVYGKDGKLIPLDLEVKHINELLHLPTPSSSSVFAPQGVFLLTHIWSVFLTERLSHCNHAIHTLTTDALRQCLFTHGLNQLGSSIILKRRLQEFVRRVRGCLSLGVNDSKMDHVLTEFDSMTDNGSTGRSMLSSKLFTEVVEDDFKVPLNGAIINGKYKTVKLTKPAILTPDTFYSYLLIIDLEATCDVQDQGIQPEYLHEIIEFPILLYNTQSRQCVSVFHAYCKPRLNPTLTSFCTNLTHISQNQIDNAQPFTHVLINIHNWLINKHGLSNVRCAIVCDCSADMAKFMRIQCHLDGIPLPTWATVWINLTKAFRMFYKLPCRYRVTLSSMLRELNLTFLGQRHSGLDDAVNILRVVRTLLSDGCLLRVNERVDLGRPPHYMASVPKAIAEITSGLMGSSLILLSRKKTGSSQCKTTINGHANSDTPNQCAINNVPEEHKQSLLWLANIQKSRISHN